MPEQTFLSEINDLIAQIDSDARMFDPDNSPMKGIVMLRGATDDEGIVFATSANAATVAPSQGDPNTWNLAAYQVSDEKGPQLFYRLTMARDEAKKWLTNYFNTAMKPVVNGPIPDPDDETAHRLLDDLDEDAD